MRKTFVFWLIILLLYPAFAMGQTSGAYDYHDTIEREGFTPIKVAISLLQIKGAASSDDSLAARGVYAVICDDLDFHFVIDTVMLDPFILRVYEVKTPDAQIWKMMGAEQLLELSVEFSDEKVRVDYSLQNLKIMRETASGGYRMESKYWRHLAHTISDQVVNRLTGYEGIFRTSLAYISARTGNKEVYVCDYDGYNAQKITNNGSINLSPVWDAENENIYYTSYRSGHPDLWEVNLKKGASRSIASYPGINSSVAVSPNNHEIALTLSKDGNAEIYLADRDGHLKKRLTQSPAIETAPWFSPSGKELAFVSDRTGERQIYMMDLEGLNLRRVTYQGKWNESPSISPDGTRIAYLTMSERGSLDVCVADISGTNVKVITHSGFNENPCWAPDGLHLVYATRFGDKTALYITDYLGTRKRLICNEPGCSNPRWSGLLR